MKKILFSILALVAVMSANATEKTSAIGFDKMSAWEASGDYAASKWDAATKTLTADSWYGGNIWFGYESESPLDATGYEQLVLEVSADNTLPTYMYVTYTDKTTSEITIAAGKTKGVITLPSTSTKIQNIDIKNAGSVRGSIVLTSLYLRGMEGTRTVSELWSGSNDQGNWSWENRVEVAYDKFDKAHTGAKLVFSFTEGSSLVSATYYQIGTYDGDGNALTSNSDERGGNTYLDLKSGATSYTMELNSADVESLKSKGLQIKGYNIVMTKVELVYYVETPVDPTIDEIDLTQAMTGWDSSYDPTTKTVTWTKGWGGCGWWFGGKDCSGYSKVVYEFDGEAPYSGGLTVQYATGSESYVGFESGATTVEYTFDPTRSASVNAIYLKLADAGSLKLKRVYFEKATEPTQVKVNMYVRAEMGCATFCAPFEVEIPGEVEAYKATSIEGDAINLEKVEGTIPAYTPVVLTYKGESDFTQDFTHAIATGSETAGILTGNYTDAINVVPVNSYILQCNDNKTGWYQVADENKLKVGPNRCYLTNSVDARAFYGMNFGETTGIQNVAAVVATKADGKYLVNGQFVVVKAGKAYNMNGQVIK